MRSIKLKNLKSFHWLVITLSFTLTLFVWWISSRHVKANFEARFNNEAEELIDEVIDQMKIYEDTLWSGVGALKSHSSGFDRSEFKRFSDGLNVIERHPGINGIGVIFKVEKQGLDKFLDQIRIEKPDFSIFPNHEKETLYPITFIEPEAANVQAIGLDMAHEKNRYDAVLKAEATKKAQITGPITLVQDQTKTPGFLFYAPFFEDTENKNLEGLVYAPFVFNKLMKGTLSNVDKPLDVSIKDGSTYLYQDDEFKKKRADKFNRLMITRKLELYGRIWTFEISPNSKFGKGSKNSEPALVLCAGIIINILIILLFLSLSRSRERAIVLAQTMNQKAEDQKVKAVTAAKLASLGEMAGGIAHEINNPLAILSGNTTRIRQMMKSDKVDVKKTLEVCGKMDETILRISKIISSMRILSRDGSEDPFVKTSVLTLVSDVVIICEEKFKHNEIDFQVAKISENLNVMCRPVQIAQVLVNLLNNAYDAIVDTKKPTLRLDVLVIGEKLQIRVADSGPRIPDDLADRIMAPFFTTKGVGKGTGLGLSISKKIMENHKGRLFLDRTVESTTFVLELNLES